MKRLARLTVYAAAMLVVLTARLPDPSSSVAALRTTPDHAPDPVRSLLATVLLIGILIEVLRRRSVWH